MSFAMFAGFSGGGSTSVGVGIDEDGVVNWIGVVWS